MGDSSRGALQYFILTAVKTELEPRIGVLRL